MPRNQPTKSAAVKTSVGPSGRGARKDFAFCFVGHDKDHAKISELDGTHELTLAQKFEMICALSLFEYQMRNNTNDIPRFLRTTACIRKA